MNADEAVNTLLHHIDVREQCMRTFAFSPSDVKEREKKSSPKGAEAIGDQIAQSSKNRF